MCNWKLAVSLENILQLYKKKIEIPDRINHTMMMAKQESDSDNEMIEYSNHFMAESPLDHSKNFEEWLDKNGVHYIIRNEYLKDTVIYNKQDPLLNQVNAKESLSLDSFNDADIMNEFAVDKLNVEEPIKRRSIVICPVNAEMEKRKRNGKSKSKHTYHKLQQFADLIKSGLSLQIFSEGEHFKVLFFEKEVKLPFSYQLLSSEAGGQSQQDVKQPIVAANKVEIAPTLEIEIVRLDTVSGLHLFLCPQLNCQQSFFRLASAKLHSLIHLEHKPYKCDFPECTWAFYTPFKLKRHQETHTKRKDFICPVADCSRRFTTIYNLNCHKRLHNRPADLPCPVKNCSQKFQTSRAREHHLKSHDRSEAPYNCSIVGCNKVFFFLTALTAHARIHTYKETEHRCEWPNCGKVFEQPCRLKEHVRMHTGQRPYSCTYEDCKWAFATASKLKRHQSTHTNDRKFHCTIGTCTKSFMRSEHLKEHTLTHIGQRAFQCEVCGVGFLGKSALYLHIRKSHPEHTLACARALPYNNAEKANSDILLEQAIQSLGVPSDMMLGTGLLPEEPLELLENEHFSTVNLRDLD